MESHGHEVVKPLVETAPRLVNAVPRVAPWVMQPLTEKDNKAKE